MKKILFLFLIIFTTSQTLKADTIDVWHVYYNKIKLGEFNTFGKNKIVLKLDSLKIGDSITIKYFKDTRCYECITHVIVEDEKQHNILTSTGKGSYNPVSFSVNKLIELKRQGYDQDFQIFYIEGELKNKSDKNLILSISIE
jgi:hypothetical protein